MSEVLAYMDIMARQARGEAVVAEPRPGDAPLARLLVALAALRLLDRGCEHDNSGRRCFDPGSGYVFESVEGWADSWCDPCIARYAARLVEEGLPC